jgi:hypothetical protein
LHSFSLATQVEGAAGYMSAARIASTTRSHVTLFLPSGLYIGAGHEFFRGCR